MNLDHLSNPGYVNPNAPSSMYRPAHFRHIGHASFSGAKTETCTPLPQKCHTSSNDRQPVPTCGQPMTEGSADQRSFKTETETLYQLS